MKTPKNSLRGHNQFRDAILVNSQTYFDFLERFKKIATSMFEWKNLPDSMDGRYLELSLYYMGKACILYDEEYGLINTKCGTDGRLNIYGIPTSLQCWSYSYNTIRNTYQGFDGTTDEEKELVRKNTGVLVMNNNTMIPTAPTLELFAQRLAECQRTADINIKQQKYNRMIFTDKKQELTMRQVVNQIDNNELNVFVDRNSMSPDAIRSVDTGTPYIADKLMEYEREIWNQALTFLGISNMDTKRERMIVSESDSKNELINLNLQSYLMTRKKACEECNKLFGTNIDVAVRSDLHNFVKEIDNSFQDLKDQMADEIVEDAVNGKENK